MKPVILITLHRRYHEFVKTIKNIHSKFEYFSEKPTIYVVWSDPEPGRYWLLDLFKKNNLIDFLITRHVLPDENGKTATTFYESQNIRLGLENVFRNHPDSYCIVQASDISITEYGFHLIDTEMNRGAKGIVFSWINTNFGAFHTNCFCVTNDKDLWPPFADKKSRDVLERLWYKDLERKNLIKNFTNMSNYNKIIFSHEHISENLEQFPIKAALSYNQIYLHIEGTVNILDFILNFFRCIFMGDRNGKNSNRL